MESATQVEDSKPSEASGVQASEAPPAEPEMLDERTRFQSSVTAMFVGQAFLDGDSLTEQIMAAYDHVHGTSDPDDETPEAEVAGNDASDPGDENDSQSEEESEDEDEADDEDDGDEEEGSEEGEDEAEEGSDDADNDDDEDGADDSADDEEGEQK